MISSPGFLSLERQGNGFNHGGNWGMSSNNIIDFQSELDKRRVPDDDTKKSSDYQYVLELEHEILELQHQVCMLQQQIERAVITGS